MTDLDDRLRSAFSELAEPASSEDVMDALRTRMRPDGGEPDDGGPDERGPEDGGSDVGGPSGGGPVTPSAGGGGGLGGLPATVWVGIVVTAVVLAAVAGPRVVSELADAPNVEPLPTVGDGQEALVPGLVACTDTSSIEGNIGLLAAEARDSGNAESENELAIALGSLEDGDKAAAIQRIDLAYQLLGSGPVLYGADWHRDCPYLGPDVAGLELPPERSSLDAINAVWESGIIEGTGGAVREICDDVRGTEDQFCLSGGVADVEDPDEIDSGVVYFVRQSTNMHYSVVVFLLAADDLQGWRVLDWDHAGDESEYTSDEEGIGVTGYGVIDRIPEDWPR